MNNQMTMNQRNAARAAGATEEPMQPTSPKKGTSMNPRNRTMKTTLQNRIRMAFAVVAGLTFAAAPAEAGISLVNSARAFCGNQATTRTNFVTAHNGTTQVSYDATEVSKLVVVIGSEPGFNNNSNYVTGVKFNNVALTQAVQDSTKNTAYDGGTCAIFYLDNPYQGVATFSWTYITTGGNPNGGIVSIIGLAGTAAGVGSTNKAWFTQTTPGNVSVNITTSADNSWVIAGVENSGANNSAGTPTAVAPLTLITNGNWGSQWGSVASGYHVVPASGTTITPTFSTAAGGNIHVIAVEFKSADLPPLVFSSFGPLSGTSFPLTFSGPNDQSYQMLTSTNLALPLSNWTVVTIGTFGGSPVTYTDTNATSAQKFYCLKPLAPTTVFSDDFESGIGAWSLGSEGAPGTAWELGSPRNVGPTTAHSPTNCFGSNLAGNYDIDANIWLRSPVIDLRAVGSATLEFWQFTSIWTGGNDFGTVSVLDASDESVLAVLAPSVDGDTASWVRVRRALPAAALGKQIKLEFRFQSVLGGKAGWYIDDVRIVTP